MWQVASGKWQVAVLTLFALLLIACGNGKEDVVEGPIVPDVVLEGVLPIEVPVTAVTGNLLEVNVGPISTPDNVPVFLTYISSYGNHLMRASFQNGFASFQLPPDITKRSGSVSLIATSGNARGEAIVELLPGAAIEPITPLVGARTIIADGDHWSMAIMIPFDHLGNPIAEGTRVELQALHPEQNLEVDDVPIEHLLAWKRVYSGTKAGRTLIAARIDAQFGPETILQEVAGWPVPFSLSVEPTTLPADGFQLMTINSGMIVDKFDNVLPDGTLVNYIVEGADNSRRVIPVQIIDGAAKVDMQAPTVPGTYTIRATVYGMESDALDVEFTPGPALGKFEVNVEVSEDNLDLQLITGPVIGELNQFVSDGSVVTYRIRQPDGTMRIETAVTDAGYATLPLWLYHLESGHYQVQISVGAGWGKVNFTVP